LENGFVHALAYFYFQIPSARSCLLAAPAQSLLAAGLAGLG
jgi:hypothetical protein